VKGMIRGIRRACGMLALVGLLAAPASGQGAQLSDSYRAAVLELLQAMHTQQAIESSITTMTDMMVQQNPQMEQLRPVLAAFFTKYLAWEELQDRFVEVYAATFTEAEVHDLIEFYRTPTGAKAADAVPMLMQKGAEIGQQQVQDHLPELQQMIMEAVGGN
jgi:uncharacterized protein